MKDLEEVARSHNFSGVVRVERQSELMVEFAHGFADRANERPNDRSTRFATASITKGMTALTIMSLVDAGELSLGASVHSMLGGVLPRVDDAVTIEHLLAHRSGIGDYLDEEALGDIDDYVFGDRSAHTFASPSDYIKLLNAHDQRSRPGSAFVYNNSGYVILSLIIESVTGDYHQAVADRALAPAGLSRSGFFRADDLPGNTAIGYLGDGRSNVFHLPVIGAGDGGVYLTVDDLSSLWAAAQSGAIVSHEAWNKMTTATSEQEPSYGLGMWLGARGDHVWLEGMDAGVSAQSGIFRSSGLTYSVLSNTSAGAWPLAKHIVDAQST